MILQKPSPSFSRTTSPLNRSSFSYQWIIFPNSLPFLYAIHHYLINIIKLFYMFFYLNPVITCHVVLIFKNLA